MAVMVSVIVPNYNHARYLDQRLQSILNQTFRDFEVIILDDFSSDESREVIEKYRIHKKVSSIIYNNENSRSTFRQWVKGIELCKNEFVWIAESDDWCESSFLENIMNGLLQDDKCVIGFCQSYCIQDENEINWKSESASLSTYNNGESFVKTSMLLNTSIFNASMAVWRRSIFEKISMDFINYKYCGDWLFWIELSMHGNVYISGRILNYFRRHGDDISSRSNSMGDNFVEELTMFLSLYEKKWIEYDDLLNIFKNEFLQYKGTVSAFPLEKDRQIRQLLFSIKKFYLVLNYNYWKYYLKHGVKKTLKILTGYK